MLFGEELLREVAGQLLTQPAYCDPTIDPSHRATHSCATSCEHCYLPCHHYLTGDTTRQPATAFHTVFLVADPSSPVSPSWPAWVKAARRVLVSAGVMQKMMGVQSAGSVTLAAELDLPPPPDLQAWGCGQGRAPPHLTRLLVLDGVQDPGNLGSLARSALGFGFQALYLLPSCCDPWNDKAIRASQGAVLRIPIFRQGSLSHLLQTAQQHSLALVAAALPQDCHNAPRPFPGPHLKARGVALVLGSEGQGLSKEVMQACHPVTIPMSNLESLNVAAAAHILMFMMDSHRVRQLTLANPPPSLTGLQQRRAGAVGEGLEQGAEPGPSSPQPAKRSKRTKAEPEAAEPTKGKGKGKAAKAMSAPQPGRWLDRDCNAALNMQRIGESRWRPLELCYWPDQGALPAKGKEYPGLGYKRLRDKSPKAQQQQQQPAVAQ
ncbi:hypothetical protein QJQ45_021632 [Haematococcus lacustris]|nr:hypothetical protein QJQ45_021632 [Haematococcus lacustris]